MKQRAFECSRCRKKFAHAAGTKQHINNKHGGKGEPIKLSEKYKDDDESFADRAIAAQLAIACGEPTNDKWLVP